MWGVFFACPMRSFLLAGSSSLSGMPALLHLYLYSDSEDVEHG